MGNRYNFELGYGDFFGFRFDFEFPNDFYS